MIETPPRFDTLPDVADPSLSVRVHGHDKIKEQISQALQQRRLAHALLFSGPHGVGKATTAYCVARHLIGHEAAENTDELFSPASRSDRVYRQVASCAHPGFLYLTRPWDEKTKRFKTGIGVDEIRSIARFSGLTAHDGGYRIVMIDPIDDLNNSAANALLKILEEPPNRTIFLLIAHAPGRLLPTIRSRCQQWRFGPLAADSLRLIVNEIPPAGLDPRLVGMAIEHCRGSARQAILLAQFGGSEIIETVETIAGSEQFSPEKAARLAGAVSGRGNDIQFDLFNDAVLAFLQRVARQAISSGMQTEASKLGDLWQEMTQRIADTRAFNLDRKQHVLSSMSFLNETINRYFPGFGLKI